MGRCIVGFFALAQVILILASGQQAGAATPSIPPGVRAELLAKATREAISEGEPDPSEIEAVRLGKHRSLRLSCGEGCSNPPFAALTLTFTSAAVEASGRVLSRRWTALGR